MGLILCCLGFAAVAVVIRRSLGDGLGLLLSIGSIYGIARCNVFDGYTHFLFDASVLGAYVGAHEVLLWGGPPGLARLRRWVLALSTLAFVLILLSPFIDAQPVLVQLLGLRPAAFYIPLVLLGGALDREQLERLARWGVIVAFLAGATALAEYFWGVELFFPMNDASNIIYLSKDIGEEEYFRLPATFSSAHAYGAAMVGIVPLLVYLLDRRGRWRTPALFALVVAAIGVFACGARSPVLVLGVLVIGLAIRGLRNNGARWALIFVGAAVLAIVPRVTRFQRFETLSDFDYASARIGGSVNANFVDTIVDHPLGRGLGSALGTSVPFFLADQARPQIGMENEYVRIAVEEGILGLCLWVAFVLFALFQNPLGLTRFGRATDLGLWIVCVADWIQGFIGFGMLAAVPGTMLMLLYMGSLAMERGLGDSVVAPFRVPSTGALQP
jgi:hypothetical protein